MSDKIEYQLEFPVKSSPKILYNFIATPGGLSEWFADNVNSRGSSYTFIWDGSEEVAELISKKAGSHIKFKWEEENDDTFFELRVRIDDLTKDIALIITDFAEEDELDESKMLWESQVAELLNVIGG
tara:strand:- start:1835 stop:2215 length:381 start_codon:yes stop_codon:yes gene_type:complete